MKNKRKGKLIITSELLLSMLNINENIAIDDIKIDHEKDIIKIILSSNSDLLSVCNEGETPEEIDIFNNTKIFNNKKGVKNNVCSK